MPPKTADGRFMQYDLYFEDGSHATIGTVELPPEPGWEPPDFGLHNDFSVEVFMPRPRWKRIVKGLNAAVNRMNRIARTVKRKREKERRKKLKEDSSHGRNAAEV